MYQLTTRNVNIADLSTVLLHTLQAEEVGHDQSLVYGGMRIYREKPRTEAPSGEKELFAQASAV